MTYPKIDEVEAEVEIEKGCTKARYHFRNKNDENRCIPAIDGFTVMNVRATNIPTCQRIFPPKPATIRREVIMQNIKDKMINKVKEYKEKNCNEKGWIKKSNTKLKRMDYRKG